MAATNNTQPDLSVFNEQDDGKCNDKTPVDFKSCLSVKRLLAALRYYSLLQILSNAEHRQIFENFIFVVYTNHIFVNDHVHLSEKHGHQIEEIRTYLISMQKSQKKAICDLSTCTFTARHQDSAQNEADSQLALDSRLNYLKTMFDGLHFYLLHLFDVGMRLTKEEKSGKNEQNTQDENAAVAHFDAAFATMNRTISSRQHLTASFDRFGGAGSNGKFVLDETDHKNKKPKATGKAKGERTYLDELFRALTTSHIDFDKQSVLKLQQVIKDEAYDTDSLDVDFHGDDDEKQPQADGNIAKHVNDETCMKIIRETLQLSHASSSSFAVGLRFYYWPYFKDLDSLLAKDEDARNVHDHSGYKVGELYVPRKYDSFKEEMANYQTDGFDLQQYNQVVRVKVMLYMNTKIVKETTARLSYYGSCQYYGVREGTVLGYSNLVCLTMYCDYTHLSAEFTGTFRKSHPFETVQQIKRRNENYFWWAKTMRETVELYGQRHDEGLHGPVYCGMSFVMTLPQFQIRLNGPVSTTKHQEVAMTFSRASGIIIKLNNNDNVARYVRGFNCSWISRYREEDERLFFGGYWPISVQGVQIVRTNQNFEALLIELCELDKMLGGSLSRNEKFPILLAVFTKRAQMKADGYVADTFNHYRKTKTILHLSVSSLFAQSVRFCKAMVEWMMHGLSEKSFKKHGQSANASPDDSEMVNVPKQELLETFPNAKQLIIDTISVDKVYSFSLLSLLAVIKSSALTKITVKAAIPGNKRKYGDKCWLDVLWFDEAKRRVMEEKYQAQGYAIKYQREATGGDRERWIVIGKQ